MNLLKTVTGIIFVCVSLTTTATSTANVESLKGTLLVVNKKDDTVNFIDLASKKIKYTRNTGKGPHELAITKDGKWAVVTNYVGGNSLTVFDVQHAKAVRTIDLTEYSRPHGILFLRDQQRVAVSSEGSNSVVIVDIHQGLVEKVIPTKQSKPHMVALPESSMRVYAPNMSSDTVSELDIYSGKVMRQIATEETPEAITVNKKGTELWVGSNKDGYVTVYDLVSNKQIKQWRGYGFPYRILLTDDQKLAVIPDFKNDTLDVIDTSSQKRLHTVYFAQNTVPKGVAFYPDDRTLFMSAFGKDKVFVLDINNGEKLLELPTGSGPDGIGYSSLELN